MLAFIVLYLNRIDYIEVILMAIYTQYARYLKAREFKKMIEDQGDTYMLLGLGNPFWDTWDEESQISSVKMPVAPYSTEIMTHADEHITADQNQFYDITTQQNFMSGTYDASSHSYTSANQKCTIENSVPKDYTYANAVKNILPPFPCTWSGDEVIYSSGTGQSVTEIKLSNYQNYIIDHTDNSAQDQLYEYSNDNFSPVTLVSLPAGSTVNDIIYRQAYAEMYLRGAAIKAGVFHPCGLLGAVRCDINFVKDLGTDDSVYTGAVNQIWYGDRYWEIIDDPLNEEDNTLEKYINVGGNDDSASKEKIFPHHLLFNATINPMKLCPSLKIDQNIVPRHIAIYVRKQKENENTGENDPALIRGPRYYSVVPSNSEVNVFNFGQYEKTSDGYNPSLPSGVTVNMLNFTLPVNIKEGDTTHQYGNTDDATDFKFILNDYIKGSVRDKHSIDRIGYVLGF